ncbi:prepilin-type N-terminal cleavage/methylation domain-containing protein [Desulfoluna sp.]|uniref:pilin n=1 Tax=Desulfoluna sp. TaxID=2045199 RepID=UPI002634D81F|nr:prepilin-type N-terminal cleavage/methylation domain-containing protein [Desulfoluna sp.]
METTSRWKSQNGFTLIELMTVVAIIGILATIALPNYHQYILKAEAVKLVGQIEIIKTALAVAYAEENKYPDFETAAAGKAPNSMKGFLTDEIFNGPDTIVIRLRSGAPNIFRADRGFAEMNEPYLIFGSRQYGKADKLLITLQQMMGPDRFKFYMGHSWAKVKIM